MRMKTKVIIGWCAVTAVALMMCAGCAIFKSEEDRKPDYDDFSYQLFTSTSEYFWKLIDGDNFDNPNKWEPYVLGMHNVLPILC